MNADRYNDLLALSDDLDDQVSAARKAKSPDVEILLATRRAVNAEIAELGAKRYDARCAANAAQKDAERVAAAEQALRAALASSDEFAAARAAIARRRLDDARECAKVSAWMAA
jgi:hypothetical protein